MKIPAWQTSFSFHDRGILSTIYLLLLFIEYLGKQLRDLSLRRFTEINCMGLPNALLYSLKTDIEWHKCTSFIL